MRMGVLYQRLEHIRYVPRRKPNPVWGTVFPGVDAPGAAGR